METFQDEKVGGVTGPTVIPTSYKNNRDLFFFEKKFRSKNLLWRAVGYIYFSFFLENQSRRVSHWFDSGAFSLGKNFEQASKKPLQEVLNLEACNLSVRKKILIADGGFNEDYDAGLGDYHEAEVAFSVRRAGYICMFNPKAYLNHLPSKDGFFNERPGSYHRMINLIMFYKRNIRLDSPRKLIRFFLYIIFLDCYYLFIAIKSRQLKQLGALSGTVVGFLK